MTPRPSHVKKYVKRKHTRDHAHDTFQKDHSYHHIHVFARLNCNTGEDMPSYTAGCRGTLLPAGRTLQDRDRRA